MNKLLLCLIIGIINISISFTVIANNNVVYFYNWSEYVPSWILNEFTKETGIKVIYSTYESNETMYAKLKSYGNNIHYDLVVPSTYFISKMSKEGMLQKIDKNKITQFKNIDKNLLYKAFEPKNDYSIPYIWGATGIAVNTKYIDPKTINSWADLWNPIYKNKILLTDDAREVFHIALSKLGYSGNTTNPTLIKLAYEELKKLMPNVMAFNSDNPGNPFIQGEVNIGMLWNGSAYIAQQSVNTIKFIWPKEGGIFWMDSFAIPSNAKNVPGAIKLIDFLLRPDIAAKIAYQIGYPTANISAKKLLPINIINNKILYPNTEILRRGEWQNDVGNANILYEHYFQQLKTLN
uniref:Putrescine-binding periplasmic protein n=1 Tax=Candidatus Aschnera chinzeii TaxID=1485666 RepID=A0AAT9G3Q6_9ENTR|nr:MAG: spermidine/putrescine ABC transporter substrate-binding protein PotD [Candidatus Aschnera chinzeii]